MKAELQACGIECDVEYLDQAFGALLGREEYRTLSREVPLASLAADWAFAEALFGESAPAADAYVDEVLVHRHRVAPDVIDVVLQARAAASRFIGATLGDVPWERYDVVGFSASAGQNVAALAIARSIKEGHPGLRVVVGGPAWHGEMGLRQLAEFPFVDAACLGEGDVAFPRFCTRLHSGRSPHGCGLALKGGTRTAQEGRDADLDALPTPDYSDFYGGLERWGGETNGVQLAAEASRGCPWAARLPCAFCGLNGAARSYRCKSPGRILDELRELDARWQPWLIDLVDNLVPPAFLREALPGLAAAPLEARLFFEARPVLTPDELRLAATAGAHLQLGIESLSQHALDLMGKGTRVGGIVEELRWCRDLGVPVTWNLLHDVPRETAGDYREMRRLLPALHGLPAPDGVGPVELQRFSRYFARPERFGIVNVRPAAPYRHIYPFSAPVLSEVAYLFDFDLAERPLLDGELRRERDAFLHEVALWTAGDEDSGPGPAAQSGAPSPESRASVSASAAGMHSLANTARALESGR